MNLEYTDTIAAVLHGLNAAEDKPAGIKKQQVSSIMARLYASMVVSASCFLRLNFDFDERSDAQGVSSSPIPSKESLRHSDFQARLAPRPARLIIISGVFISLLRLGVAVSIFCTNHFAPSSVGAAFLRLVVCFVFLPSLVLVLAPARGESVVGKKARNHVLFSFLPFCLPLSSVFANVMCP